MPLAVEACSLNHRTAREVPSLHCSERGVVLRSRGRWSAGPAGTVAQGACATASRAMQLSAKVSVLRM